MNGPGICYLDQSAVVAGGTSKSFAVFAGGSVVNANISVLTGR